MNSSIDNTRLSPTAALVRNPLSVIALFVLLVQSISTVALVQLVQYQYAVIPLIYFVVLFPTLVSILFFSTIWWKHQFLYSPMEYRSDQSFLTAMDRLTRVEARQEAAELNPRTADENHSIKVVDRLLKLGDIRSAVKVGRTFLEAQQYDVASRIFRHIVDATGTSEADRYNALANLAYAEIGLSQFDSAIAHLVDSIKLAGRDKTGPWHHMALAYCYYRLCGGNPGETFDRFKIDLAKAVAHKWFGHNSDFFKSLYPEIASYF